MEIKMGKNKVVYGLFGERPAVERAVDALRAEGFRNEDISVLFSENEGTKEFAHEKDTKAPEGTTTGVTAGAVAGGGLGWLVGIGTLAIPGLGPFVAAGPIVSTLAGMGAGGAVGGITGALIGMGIPEYEAKRYEGEVQKGRILLSVHCDDSDWIDKAKDVLNSQHASDVSSASQESSNVAEGTATDKPRVKGQNSQSELISSRSPNSSTDKTIRPDSPMV